MVRAASLILGCALIHYWHADPDVVKRRCPFLKRSGGIAEHANHVLVFAGAP